MDALRTNWSARALRAHGPDAADFLHRLSTVNVKRMGAGATHRGLFLTGQSQVIAPFVLHRESADSFVLCADAVEFTALAEHLEKMHFSENLERTELAARGEHLRVGRDCEAPVGTELSGEKIAREGAVRLEWVLGASGLAAAVVYGESAASLLAFPDEEELRDPDLWEELRIRARLPRFGREWDHESRALDVGFLGWIDRDKGCYPGQEVVEKSLNVGHPARALVRLRGTRAPAELPTELEADGKPAGRLTSAVSTGFDALALAVVKWDKREPGTRFRALADGNEFTVEKEGS